MSREAHVRFCERPGVKFPRPTHPCHNVLDVAFQEDNRPWVTHSAQGMLVLILLRRLAYTLLALWRGRTLKGDDNRLAAWKKVFAWVVRALEQATQAALGADLPGRRGSRVIPAV